jgi:UDP-N-acetylglucosamine 2-epimerase
VPAYTSLTASPHDAAHGTKVRVLDVFVLEYLPLRQQWRPVVVIPPPCKQTHVPTLATSRMPRTQQSDRAVFDKVRKSSRLRIIPAVSFLEMILLEKSAEIIMTDSGGVQKEAYYFHRPCVIMLEETPWVELIESGTALLAGSDGRKIRDAYQKLHKQSAGLQYPPIFGDGKAAGFICEKIIENFG